MTAERPPRTVLSSIEAAALLGTSPRTLFRVPREDLPYWETPGGGVRRHRRYERPDVVRYAREFLGRELPDED